MAETSRKQLTASLKDYLTSGQYSDLTITCGKDTYNVHKVIVCSRVGFFARAISFPGQEAQDGKINLPEDDPLIIKLMMRYIYEGDYKPLAAAPVPGNVTVLKISMPKSSVVTDDGATRNSRKRKRTVSPAAFPHTCDAIGSNTGCRAYAAICPHHICGFTCRYACNRFVCQTCKTESLLATPIEGSSYQLLTHAKMYELADKYDVVGLKKLVEKKFTVACDHFWDDKIFAVAAHHVFCTTPDHDKGLRDIVVNTLTEHMDKLLKKPEMEALLTEFSGLAYGLLKKKSEAGWR